MGKNNLVVERDQLAFTMSRVFDAPRDLVWKVYIDPALVPQRWGRRDSVTNVDKMDVRVGGEWRYVEKGADGVEHAFRGVYTEIHAPELLAYTFEYEPMAGHVSVDTLTFVALPGGKTRIDIRTTFNSLEDMEGMLQSGMEEGSTELYDRLEELLAEIQLEG